MKCPNCDFIDKDEAFGEPAICPKCSAIYEKALRIKQLKEQEATLPGPAPRPPAKKASPTINERLAGARIGIKEAREKRKHEGAQTLYTKEGTPVLIKTRSNGGGCLRPLAALAVIVFLITLFNMSSQSYKGYADRSGSPELAFERDRQAAERRKNEDDDIRRIKMHRIVREGVKEKLRDPDAAKFRNQRGACGEVNSKNLFGAYTGYQRFMYGGADVVFLENDPALADGAFDEAWNKLCTESLAD